MSSLKSLIVRMLEISIDNLKNDLLPLQNTLKSNKEGMFITHNGLDTILVYADNKYRAYIPKKYESWEIHFIHWNGIDDIKLDIDEEIYI